MEVAALGLKVEGVEGIDRAAASLDGLAAAGVKAEASSKKVEESARKAKKPIEDVGKAADDAADKQDKRAKATDKASNSDEKSAESANKASAARKKADADIAASIAAQRALQESIEKLNLSIGSMGGRYREQIDSMSRASVAMGIVAKESRDVSAAALASVGGVNAATEAINRLANGYQKIPKVAPDIPIPKIPSVIVPPEAPKALSDLEKRAAAAGMSVGAMSAALRGVPAQFTDIAVSLQGGMNPLTVFLQQGGQLKDMFGGAGNAARALGGYVAGLVNPFTVAAAGAVALGVAYYQGSKEQDAFMVSMAKTGNAAGVTTSGLKAYAEQISSTVGTQGKAAESLNIFIDSGVKAGASLARLTETAIAWEKATGEGVDKVAAKYVALQNDPLKAAMKLNEGMNFLTLSVYEQISALEDQGKTTDAAKVAMDALDKAMADRSKTIEENLGSIQRAWNGITGAAKTAWDAMLNIGRPSSLNDQLLDVEKQLERLMGTQGFGETEGGAATGRVSAGQQAKIRESIQALQDRKAALMGQAEAERWSADATKKNSEAVAAKAAWDKIVNATLSKSEKLEQALAKVRETAAAAGITGVELEKQLNAERKKYAETTKKATGEFKTFLTSIEAKIAANEAELFSAGKLTESAKLQIELDTKVKTGKFKLSDAQKELAKDSIKRLADQEKEQKAIARSIALNDERIASEEEMNKAMADMDRQVTQVKLATFEYSQSIADQIEMTELETKTIGMNAQARQVLIEQLRIEQDLRKRRQAINDAPFASDEARNAALSALDAEGAKAMALTQRKVYVAEWEKTSELIGDTLADYIMGGGKDAATYLKRLFSTLVLQPVVQAAFGGITGSPGSSLMSGGGSASSMLSNFSSGITGSLGSTIAGLGAQFGSTAATAFGSGIAAGGQLGLFGGGIGQGASLLGSGVAGSTASGLGTLAGAAGPWIAGAAVLLKVLKGFDDSGTPHSGAGAVYSAAGGLQTGASIYNQATFGLGHPDEYSEAMQSGVSEITKGLAQTLDAFSVAFGKTAGYSVATAFADDSSKDGAWGSLKIADEVGKVLVDWGMDRESKFAPREFADGEAGYKEYLNAVAVDVKNAFVAMDLPGWADQILNAATDIDTLNTALQQIATVKTAFEGLGQSMAIFSDLSGDLQTRLLNASGGIDSLVSRAGAFYQGFYTEGERALNQREQQMKSLSGMGLAIDPYQGHAAKEAFRKAVEDAMAAGQAEMVSQLLAMSGAFAQTADYAQGLTESIKEVAESIIDLRGPLISLESRFAGGGFSRQYQAQDAAAQLQKLLSGVGIEKDAAGLASTLMSATASEVESYFREIWNVLPTDAAKLELSGLANTMLDLAAATEEARDAAAQATAQAVSGAWANLGTASGWAAQYLGDSSGMKAQLAMVQASYQGATTVEGRESSLAQIIALEQSIFQADEKNRQAAAQAAQKQAQSLQGQLSSVNGILSATQRLREYAQDLFSGSASGLSDAKRLDVLSAQYKTQLALARGGDVDAIGKLQGTTGEYLALAQQISGNQSDYSVLSAQIASELAATAVIQEAAAAAQARLLQSQIDAALSTAQYSMKDFQVSLETQALIATQLQDSAMQFDVEMAAMQAQLQAGLDANMLIGAIPSELGGVLNKTLVPAIGSIASAAMAAAYMSASSANAAMQAADSALSAVNASAFSSIVNDNGIDGSHAGGLKYVPFDGYRAELHEGERVLTAEENRSYHSVSSSAKNTAVSADVVSVLLGIKSDNRLTSQQMLSRIIQIARRLDDWNGNGLPATRDEETA